MSIRHFHSKHVSLLLLAGLAACGDNTEADGLHTRLSGEELYRGLVFGEGRVAAELPEVWGSYTPPALSADDAEKQRAAKAQILDELRQQDPTFFPRFAASLQSGEHIRISRALSESATLTRRVVKVPEHAVVGDPARTCVAVTLVVAGNVAVAVNVAAVFNVAVNINWVYDANYLWGGGDDGGGGDGGGDGGGGGGGGGGGDDDGENAWISSALGRDQVIDMIATRFDVE